MTDENEKTEREKLMENNIEGMKWVAKVVNREEFEDEGFEIQTKYSSDKHSLDLIAHKVKLDMITNLRYRYEKPIKIFIKRVDDKIRIQDEMNKMEEL